MAEGGNHLIQWGAMQDSSENGFKILKVVAEKDHFDHFLFSAWVKTHQIFENFRRGKFHRLVNRFIPMRKS